MTSARKEPLRVGVLLEDWTVPRWVEDIVRTIQGSTYARVVLVIRNGSASGVPPRQRASVPQKIWRKRGSLAFLAYQRLDRRLFKGSTDPWAVSDLRPALDAVEELVVTPIQGRFSDRFSEEDLAAIREQRLDVAIRFGFRILRGGALEIARHGVWSFHHGDNRANRGGPPGAWEVFEGTTITGAVLQVLTETLDGGKILARVTTSTDRRSVYRNQRALFERAWPMLPRALERLHATGELQPEPAQLAYDRRLYRAPSNTQAVRGMARLGTRFLADRLIRAVSKDQWQLGYYIGAESPAPFRFRFIEPTADRFWADPFPVEDDDGYVVFFEELVYPRPGERAKAWISALRIGRDGKLGEANKVLEEPHHLSYPLVFSWHGDWYMLPESAESNQVVLYRSTHFPDTWQRHAVLIDNLAGIDNTLAEIEGRWWLWVTLRLPGTANADETLLFHADSPLGPFTPHPANPVATDVRNARGAGRPFLHEGSWIRPTQDGSGRYGRATVFMRIDRLDDDGYVETELARIEPEWTRSVVGTHTYNRAGQLHMIDVLRRLSRVPRSTR